MTALVGRSGVGPQPLPLVFPSDSQSVCVLDCICGWLGFCGNWKNMWKLEPATQTQATYENLNCMSL